MIEQREKIESEGRLERVVSLIAKFIVKRRLFIFIVLVLASLFWGYQMLSLSVNTYFPDLLPRHQYIDLLKKYSSFGGANQVLIEIRVKEGTIFNPNTLDKIIKISDDLIYIQGVDRNKIVSIGVSKIKNFKATAWGLEFPSLMFPAPPETDEEMEALKRNIYSNTLYYGKLISMDSKSALIVAEFFSEGVDYDEVYSRFQKILKDYSDENNEIFIVGGPYLYGLVSHYLPQTGMVLTLTILSMFLLTFLYTRSFRLTVLPMLSALICGIWGLGFLCFIGYNLDPLILVIPLLVSARALSHSIQFNWRIHEEFAARGEIRGACEATIKGLFYPGVAGIITDGMGILLIAFLPIPILMKLGLVIFFWSMSMILIVLILNPVLYFYFPPMKKVNKWREKKKGGLMEGVMRVIALSSKGKGGYVIICIAIIMAVITGYYALKLNVGDVYPGTPILKESSAYNQACAVMYKDFPGLMDPLLIIARADGERGIVLSSMMNKMSEFQSYLMQNPLIEGTVSIADLIKNLHLKFMENNPKYYILPDSDSAIGEMLFLLMSGGAEPGDFDQYYTSDQKATNILVYCNDHTTKTIENIFDYCRDFISQIKEKHIHFDLATGQVGIVAAVNAVVEKDQTLLLIVAFSITYLFCAFFFQSFVAALLLIIPLMLANLFVFGYMGFSGLGLNLQTLPVSTIAVGIGVDYGIYLLGRIREESIRVGTLGEGILEAVRTAGNAITITGLIIIAGVAFWGFSEIKFQADMGFLLAIVTIFHLLGTLFLLPALVYLVRPKFILKKIEG